jgi:excisionase family DNA binding protein
MDMLSTSEAAQLKGTSPHVVLRAVKRGEIDAIKIGGTNLIKVNKKFEQWQRSERHAKAGQARWAKEKGK